MAFLAGVAFVVAAMCVVVMTAAPLSAHNVGFILRSGLVATMLFCLSAAGLLYEERWFRRLVIGVTALGILYCILWGLDPGDPPGPGLLTARRDVPFIAVALERLRLVDYEPDRR
jgi:hypothetical protein